jgi:CheY-like chemotaxis protein
MMPGLSGREVIARFRVMRPGVPIVCITGFASQREEDGAIALEVNAIVAKPFTSKVLLRAVESAIAAGATSD